MGYFPKSFKPAANFRRALSTVWLGLLTATAIADTGQAAFQRRDYEAAAAQFMLRAEGGDPVAQNNLGVLYEKQGKIEEAKAQYRQALQIDPDYGNAKENLRRLGETEGGGQ